MDAMELSLAYQGSDPETHLDAGGCGIRMDSCRWAAAITPAAGG